MIHKKGKNEAREKKTVDCCVELATRVKDSKKKLIRGIGCKEKYKAFLLHLLIYRRGASSVVIPLQRKSRPCFTQGNWDKERYWTKAYIHLSRMASKKKDKLKAVESVSQNHLC